MFPSTNISPISCGGPDSYEGTPDTKLTAFSPEDTRAMKNGKSTLQTPAKDVPTDPFLSSDSKSKIEPKLSATASSFKPFGLKVVSLNSSTQAAPSTYDNGHIPGTASYLHDLVEKHSPTRPSTEQEVLQSGSFTTNTETSRSFKVSTTYSYSGGFSPLVESVLSKMQLVGSYRLAIIGGMEFVRFSNIVDSRNACAKIRGAFAHVVVDYISTTVFNQAISPAKHQKMTAHEGQVVLRASYPRTSDLDKKAFEESMRGLLAVEGPLCAWQKMTATEAGVFKLVAEFEDSSHVLRAIQRLNGKQYGDAPITTIIHVSYHTPDMPVDSNRTVSAVATTPTRRVGDIASLNDSLGNMSINRGETSNVASSNDTSGGSYPSTPGYGFVANGNIYNLPADAISLMMSAMNTGIGMGTIGAYIPNMNQHSAWGGMNGYTPFTPTYAQHGIMPDPYGHMGVNPMQMSPGFFTPESRLSRYGSTPRSTGSQYYNDRLFNTPSSPTRDMDFYNRPSGRRQNAMKIIPHGNQRGRSNAAGHHNHVDVSRIKSGIDVRTTVMLRNIPNKVDQAMLKSIIDESSHGKYDFMYLRIDFSNNCNVGYAFINFVDPLDIIDFVIARSNQKWHRFKSDKVAEVSYATIQGRDCLIQKFRNSSVMLEPAHYRPKLFYTYQDPLQRLGQEEEFPTSDNASKLKRSCENAEHVGLFAPSAGQHVREEQRHRRSQYDRGTSLAQREEFCWDDEMMPLYLEGGSPYGLVNHNDYY